MTLNFKSAIMAVAALATMGLTSCSNEEEKGAIDNAPKTLSVKISGVEKGMGRAIEDPGSNATGTIQLTNGHIYVVNPLGVVVHNEALNLTTAIAAGQPLTAEVAADSRVYIICNIPSSELSTITNLGSWNDIQAATSLLTTQIDYTEAALANSDGSPQAITAGANATATVSVAIKPLISRMELTQVKGHGDITSFTVSGVYVDDYYPSFTYGGSFAGIKFAQGSSTTFTGIRDTGAWTSTGSPLVAIPASGKVWAHNVAAGALPRFIIALTNVKYNPGLAAGSPEGEVDLGTTTYYLTVTGYTDLTSSTFQRGKIYRIGAADGITFEPEDLGLTPNPDDVDLTVNVSIEEWAIETPGASL